MTFLFWLAVTVGVVWGLAWAAGEVIEAWTTRDRFADITELLERER